MKDGVEIKAGGRFKFLHEDDESMALIIKGVTYDDAGKYTVRAKNDLGEVTTNGHLLVKGTDYIYLLVAYFIGEVSPF